MNKRTEEAIKEEMEYTETPVPECRNCQYYTMEDDPYLDRSWVYYCNYNNLGKISINQHGRCKLFKVKK
jgi:hypothetical protein